MTHLGMSSILFLLTRRTGPSQPTLQSSVTSTSITVALSAPAGAYFFREYCVNFTRTSVSGVWSPLPTQLVCNTSNSVSLSGIEEAADYTLHGFAVNTEGTAGAALTAEARTIGARK